MQSLPRLGRRAAAAPRPRIAGGRDHALALHRFLGVLQIFGGVTLVAAYGLGAEPLRVSGASSAEVVLGLLQIAVGITWLLSVRALRNLILRRPGLFVGLTLLPAVLVMVLGGSNDDVLYATSAMCWLLASGYALPGYRWILVSAAVTIAVSVVWALVEGGNGGWNGDGHYGTALLSLAAAVFPGLWLGRTTGRTSSTLNRWHLVELHDRGLVEQLRAQLERVDTAAAHVAVMLPEGASTAELTGLRERLRLGLTIRATDEPAKLTALFAELKAAYDSSGPAAPLALAIDDSASAVELSAPTADALAEVVRRQLGNVDRHAPSATKVHLIAVAREGLLTVRIEDDGAGRLPFRAGTGTEWSTRQLSRIGGSARYYAGEAGVGFEVSVQAAQPVSISDVPGLSVTQSLDGFGIGMLGALRWAGYAVDSLAAYAASAEIGARWLVMPIGAACMELVIQFGLPRVRLSRDQRLLVASLIVVAICAVFAIPSDSPDLLIPATTSVVVLAHLVQAKRAMWWFGAELLRTLAVVPLVLRNPGESIELVIVYPIGFTLIAVALTRFVDRAMDLERTAADGIGRAALAGVAVRGLALHHDAIDVILRSGPPTPELRAALAELGGALDGLATMASGSLDPRDVMRTGAEAALAQPGIVHAAAADERAPDALFAAAASVDRITLIELAALAADERASCAPPGLLGRRRLKRLAMEWTESADGRTQELTLVADPALRAPDERSSSRLRAVADAIGVSVDSSPERLRLSLPRQ